ncbi:Uncharacterized protein TCM_020358 [Theobroma cacao]|uniref:Uncharacterized protein n=1 Tax=Theobroma cacao TaxID=3641 RepID=A0A061EKZ0_THECC|nr:Uncharacterized protein TCM_020358 [Theobroma cacao]
MYWDCFPETPSPYHDQIKAALREYNEGIPDLHEWFQDLWEYGEINEDKLAQLSIKLSRKTCKGHCDTDLEPRVLVLSLWSVYCKTCLYLLTVEVYSRTLVRYWQVHD